MSAFRFDAAISGTPHVQVTADELAARGVAAPVVAAVLAAATSSAIEAEMRRRVAATWCGKRPSAQSYWTALVAKGAAATAGEAADRDVIAAGDAWEGAMLDVAKALAAKGDLDAARGDASWPAAPAALAALIAEPFAL